MDFVGPIRETAQIEAIKGVLARSNWRDYCMFVVGVNCWLSVEALLSLRIGDVVNDKGVRDVMTSEVYGAYGDVSLSCTAKEAIAKYLHSRLYYSAEAPLFLSKKGGRLQRVQAWQIVRKAAQSIGMTESIGLHTMRKTYGYQALQRGVSVEQLRRMYHHQTSAITLAYLGVYQYLDESRSAATRLEL